MTATIISSITAVFTAIGEWIVSAIEMLQPIFWTSEGLTFLGVLAVCGLAFSVVFLIIGIIQRFLHFRG